MSWSQNGSGTPGPTSDADTFTGGSGADTGNAGGGNDLMDGGAGNDQLIGGVGDDTIEGGAGTDVIFGDSATPGGNDLITDLGDGAEIYGGAGNDTVNLTVVGTFSLATPSSAPPRVLGEPGNDSLFATGSGYNDGTLGATMLGGTGDDTISGSDAPDSLRGDADNDVIFGNGGIDTIRGDEGNDTLAGGAGDDLVLGGNNNDLVVWRSGDGSDTVDFGTGADTLDLQGWDGSASDPWTETTESDGARLFTYTGAGGGAVRAYGIDAVTCFAEGTRILTARGEVPVDSLRAGDLVAAPGRGAPFKPVRWVGHTRLEIAHHRDKRKVAPVLVRAGALGAGVPARDLRVSPEHGLLLDGRLVPALLLVNGTTILQETWRRAITYWHVELDEHGVLVAEGALAESYFDDGNRHLFDNGAIALHADLGAGRRAGRYAEDAFAPPLLDADDPALARIRAALPGEAAVARSA